MPENKQNVHIKVVPTGNGKYRAFCPEIVALSAEGGTPESAAEVLKTLIETHTEHVVVVDPQEGER